MRARVAHIPYPSAVEKGTVRGVHGQKGGVVWVEYPSNTTLYEVAQHLLFPTPQEAERHRQDAQGGKGGKRNTKTNSPAPANQGANPPTNPYKDPKPPTEPTNQTKPPSQRTKMWDPATGSHEV